MEQHDVVVVGGGIVGLATALRLKEQRPGLSVTVIEKETEVAKHQTGHNSGVIHSGIYYKPGSLKARNCTEGYARLLQFAQEENIPYELCGKVIVATREEELPILETIFKRGQENGLEGLKMLGLEEVKAREPHVAGIKGILVPQTGIIDYTLVAQKYAERLERLGGQLRLGEKVLGVRQEGTTTLLRSSKGEHQAKLLVNCAGLYSDKVARMTTPDVDVKIVPFRGEYYMLTDAAKHLVKHLIYPVPDPNFPFLGVHFTRMANGHIEAGPNAVLAYRREGYTKGAVHLGELAESLLWPGFQKVAWKYWRTGLGELKRSYSKKAFTKALQRLIPELKEEHLVPAEAGVRAQAASRGGGLLDDFAIRETESAVNVLNAPSPAATSSLAIGQAVSERVLKRFDG